MSIHLKEPSPASSEVMQLEMTKTLRPILLDTLAALPKAVTAYDLREEAQKRYPHENWAGITSNGQVEIALDLLESRKMIICNTPEPESLTDIGTRIGWQVSTYQSLEQPQ